MRKSIVLFLSLWLTVITHLLPAQGLDRDEQGDNKAAAGTGSIEKVEKIDKINKIDKIETMQAEKMPVTGDYSILETNKTTALVIKRAGSALITLKPSHLQTGPAIVWVRARISGADRARFYLGQQKIILKDSYYYQWQKFAYLTDTSARIIRIENRNSRLEIDQFALAGPGIRPFNRQFVFYDLLADKTPDGKIRISFSAPDLTGARVTLYRRMQSEDYARHIREKHKLMAAHRLFYALGKQWVKSLKKIKTVLIERDADYFIVDDQPLDRIECHYYLRVENDFGQSLVSKKITVKYDAARPELESITDQKIIEKSYSFQDQSNEIKLQTGHVQPAKEDQLLYLDRQAMIRQLPPMLKGAYFFQGLSQTENVVFYTGKTTDVYLYLPDPDHCPYDYFYEKGFKLLRVPLPLSEAGPKYTTFLHKTYRAKSGDSLFVQAYHEQPIIESVFSVSLDGDDLNIYFKDNKTPLAGSQMIFGSVIDQNNGEKLLTGAMQKLCPGLWKLVLAGAAHEYENKKIRFEFYNQENTTLQNPDWKWDFFEALKSRPLSQVVFFKERSGKNYDINFSSFRHGAGLGLSDYWINSGETMPLISGREKSRSQNRQPILKSRRASKDHSLGFFDQGRLIIEYSSLGRLGVGRDWVEIVYSFDHWQTRQSLIMEAIGFHFWQAVIKPPEAAGTISYYFKSHAFIDQNQQKNWNWQFRGEQKFNQLPLVDPARQEVLKLAAGEEIELHKAVGPGIYSVRLLAERKEPDKANSLQINGRCFFLNQPGRICQIRGQQIFFDQKIRLKNIGAGELHIFSLCLNQDMQQISRFILPGSMQTVNGSGGQEIKKQWFQFQPHQAVIRVNMELADETRAGRTLQLIFNAYSGQPGQFLTLSLDQEFKEASILAKIKLTGESTAYEIDLDQYQEQASVQGGGLTLYLKGEPGTTLLTHRHEAAPFIFQSGRQLKPGTAYQGRGTISRQRGGFRFTETEEQTVFETSSEAIDLAAFLDVPVLVSGTVKQGQLTVLAVVPIIYVTKVVGDTYTNKTVLNWEVFCNTAPDQILYCIHKRFPDPSVIIDWGVTNDSKISHAVAEEGKYSLLLVPLLNGLEAGQYAHHFIVDRCGPSLSVTENIPAYSNLTEHEISLVYEDDYSDQNMITAYYRVTGQDNGQILLPETQLNVVSGKALLSLPEGAITIEIYARDQAGNRGDIFSKSVAVDLQAPHLTVEHEYRFSQSQSDQKQSVFFKLSKTDNCCTASELVTFYSFDNSSWQDTTDDLVLAAFTDFATDGEYTFYAYCQDKSGLQSEPVTHQFKIDRSPLAAPISYSPGIDGKNFAMSWPECKDAEFKHYRIRKEANPDLSTDFGRLFIVSEAHFIDRDSIYDPDAVYYLSQTDIYGNISPELTCPALQTKAISGSVGEEKTIVFEKHDSSFTVQIDEDTPPAIGMVPLRPLLDEHEQGEYRLVEGKTYRFEPAGAVFKKGLKWKIDLSALPDEQTAKKKNLTVYYYNALKNRWQETGTKYDAQTDQLVAEIKHFSIYGIGEKNEQEIDPPKEMTTISSLDGSINAVIDLFKLPGHREDFELKIDFDSNRFNQISKFLHEKAGLYAHQERDMKPVLDMEDGAGFNGIDGYSFYRCLYEAVSGNSDIYRYAIYTYEIFDYSQYPVHLNQLDYSWQINIPQLICDDPGEKEFSAIKLEDGSVYPLKPFDQVYKNRSGKKFIYRELENGYLVKGSAYLNYFFNDRGKIECVFYSNEPQEVVKSIDIAAKIYPPRVCYSYQYDENGVLKEINAHDKEGQIQYRVLAEFDTVTAFGQKEYHVKRLCSLSKYKVEQEQLKKIKKIDFFYQNIPSLTGLAQSYLYTYNQAAKNRDQKIRVNYQRLVKIGIEDFDPYENNGTAVEKEEKKIAYSLGNNYKVVDLKHEKSPLKHEELSLDHEYFNKCESNPKPSKAFVVLSPKVKVQNCVLSLKEKIKIKINGKKVDYCPGFKFEESDYLPGWDRRLQTLTGIVIDEKKKRTEFDFKDYTRVSDWRIFSSVIYSYCREKRLYLKDKNQTVINPDQPFTVHYHYKKNPQRVLTPFSQSLKVKKDYHYQFAADHVERTLNPDRYLFVESINHKIFGPVTTRTGVFTGSYGAAFESGYQSAGQELEDLVTVSAFKREENVIGGVSRLYERHNSVKQSGDQEKMQQKVRFEYCPDDHDNVQARYDYLNSLQFKKTAYAYLSQLTDDELFLNPRQDKSEEEVDHNVLIITQNSYDSNVVTKTRRIKQSDTYLNSDPDRKKTVTYQYDDYDMLSTQTEVSLDTADLNGLLGKTVNCQYDVFNRMTLKKTSGTTNMRENDEIVKGKKQLFEHFYFDQYSGRLLANQVYSQALPHEKTVKLFFYDREGRIYKTVSLFYQADNNSPLLVKDARVLYSYSYEPVLNNQLITGSYERLEEAAAYAAYFETIVQQTVDGSFIRDDRAAFENDLKTLKQNQFDFKKANWQFMSARQRRHTLNYVVRQEQYQKDRQSGLIEKRFLNIKTNTQNLALEKTTDTGLTFVYRFDDLENAVQIDYPDQYQLPLCHEYSYYDYSFEVKEFQGTDLSSADKVTVKRYDTFGRPLYQAVRTNDQSMLMQEYYKNNKLGQVIRKQSGPGIIESVTYNLYGPIKSITSSLRGDQKLVSQLAGYNRQGKSIYDFSPISLNAVTVHDQAFMESHFQTKRVYDHFGQLIGEEKKYDPEIMEYPAAALPALKTARVYNSRGQVIFEKNNLHAGTAYEKLGQKEFEYTYFNALKTETYFDYDPENEKIITYRGQYEYDDWQRVVEKRLYKEGSQLISRSLMAVYDQNNQVLTAYEKEKGKNWLKIVNQYNIEGARVFSEKSILKNADINAQLSVLENAAVIQCNRQYIRYDAYQRKVATVDFDKSAQYVIYNQKGEVEKEYSGLNFLYRINGQEIDLAQSTLGAARQYTYNDAGLKVREKAADEYEKTYAYDQYGRLIRESINSYQNGQARQKIISYDSLGREYKVSQDHMTQQVIQWETGPDQLRINSMQISNGAESRVFLEKEQYSVLGNLIHSIDRHGYQLREKTDRFGNITLSRKSRAEDSQLLLTGQYTYHATGKYLVEEKSMAQFEADNRTGYAYDDESRVKKVSSFQSSGGSEVLQTEKSFAYRPDGQIEQIDYQINGEAQAYSLGYIYGERGKLEQIVYPDGKSYQLDYEQDGSLAEINFAGKPLLKSIKRQNNVISSFETGDGIRTDFTFDGLQRIKSKAFIDPVSGQGFKQAYQYDRAGNIIEVDEQYLAETALVKQTFDRFYTYDGQNRLVRADLKGAFEHKIAAKLTYQPHDYYPSHSYADYAGLNWDNQLAFNYEQGANSILISQQSVFNPRTIRIQKNSNTKLKQIEQIGFYRLENEQMVLNTEYTAAQNEHYFELNTQLSGYSNQYKINFHINDTDLDNLALVDSGKERTLQESIMLYGQADGISLEYDYDLLDNRLAKKESLTDQGKTISGQKNTYQYSSDYRYLLQDDNFSYVYDTNGRLIEKADKNKSGLKWLYTWNSRGNLITIKRLMNSTVEFEEQYIYDEGGTRLKTNGQDSSTISIYDENNLIYELQKNGSETTAKDFVYALNELQALVESKGAVSTTLYYHSDILGSTRFVRDSNRQTIEETLFTPFGIELLNQSGPNQHYQYATHDPANQMTGLQYMNSRWMDNNLGRFISPDPAKDGLNWYVYADNNPTSLIDPSGLYNTNEHQYRYCDYDNGTFNWFSNWYYGSNYWNNFDFGDSGYSGTDSSTHFDFSKQFYYTGFDPGSYTYTNQSYNFTTFDQMSGNNSGYFTNAWIPQIFSRYEYEGDMRNLLNWPKVVGNAFVNLGSEAIGLGNSTINGLLNTGLAISRGEYFQQLGGEFGFYANMFKDFAVDTYHYHRTTALKQQLFDFGNTFLNPLLYEGFATTAAGAALGKMASSFNFNRFKPVKANNFLEDVPGYIDDWTGSVDDFESTLDRFANNKILKLNSLTQNNFRGNLIKITGHNPGKSAMAHHVFPQKFEPFFKSRGINIHNPEYGSWWSSTSHLQNAKAYNIAWETFISTRPTQSQILQFGKDLMKQFGQTTLF